jgi:hypothetical protein
MYQVLVWWHQWQEANSQHMYLAGSCLMDVTNIGFAPLFGFAPLSSLETHRISCSRIMNVVVKN